MAEGRRGREGRAVGGWLLLPRGLAVNLKKILFTFRLLLLLASGFCCCRLHCLHLVQLLLDLQQQIHYSAENYYNYCNNNKKSSCNNCYNNNKSVERTAAVAADAARGHEVVGGCSSLCLSAAAGHAVAITKTLPQGMWEERVVVWVASCNVFLLLLLLPLGCHI